jgi:hypothetical protein
MQRKRRSLALENEPSGSGATQKSRDAIGRCLASIGKEWGAALKLNDRGICSFQCGGFVVIVEVPWDSKAFFLYTSIMKCLPSSTAVMRKALELNYLTQATNSCTLALDPTKQQDMEIILCRSQKVDGTNPSNLVSLIKNFLRTATSIQKQLDRASRSKLSFITALPLRHQSNTRGGKGRRVRRNKKPPPAPRDKELTPTISNKTMDTSSVRGARRNDSIQTIQKAPLTDFTKMNVALGLTMAAAKGKNLYSEAARNNERQRSTVIRRLSRMASKSLPRPRASFGRYRPSPPPETIHEAPMHETPPATALEI